MKKVIIMVVLCLFLLGCKAENEMYDEVPSDVMMEDNLIGEMTEAGYIDVTPEEAKMLIDDYPEIVVIDVSPKYDEGHLPGAINYYVGDGSLDEAIPTLDPEGFYLVYCHVDSASISGAEKLIEAGFVEVYRLQGNYKAWVDAGYEVEV